MEKSSSKYSIFIYWLKGYFKLLTLSCLFLSLFRLVWFFYYKKGDELNFFLKDLAKAFFLGFRFDLSALCYLTLPSIVLWILWFIFHPKPLKVDILKIQKSYWFVILLLFAFILAADFNYYGFFQDHINVLAFGLFNDDTSALLRTFWKNYPIIKLLLFFFALGWFLYSWLAKIWEPSTFQYTLPKNSKPWRFTLNFFLFFFLISIGARGSLGLFPLEIMHTAISTNSFINSLSFNSAHALVRALQLREQQSHQWNDNLVKLGYSNNPKQALVDFAKLTNKSIITRDDNQVELYSKTKKSLQAKNKVLPNLIFILMESWGSDWITEQSTNFNILGAFDKHLKLDLFSTKIFPSSLATIGSLGSLATDLPHRIFSPFLTESVFLGVKFKQAPAQLFKDNGFETHFIYGGNLGWRSINQFLPKQGFQILHGENNIRDFFSLTPNEQIQHDWGVHDEYVFKYAKKLLESSDKPKFIFILTTSNHPPYSLPAHYNPPPLEMTPSQLINLTGSRDLNLQRLKAFQYSNDQLGLFLDDIKSSHFKANTIISATGDHSFYIRSYDNSEFFKKWSVPLYIHIPPPILQSKARPTKLPMGSHIDIFPTLYNLIFSEISYYGLGHDLLDPTLKPWSFHAPSSSSFDNQSGIVINSQGLIISSLCIDEMGQKYRACATNSSHELLQKKLTSLMGSADLLFEENRIKAEQYLLKPMTE